MPKINVEPQNYFLDAFLIEVHGERSFKATCNFNCNLKLLSRRSLKHEVAYINEWRFYTCMHGNKS